MRLNEINKELLLQFEKEHIEEGGKMPYETAITNLIHHHCKNKTYKFSTDDDLEILDVIMWSNFSNDVFFFVVVDEDGDSIIAHTYHPTDGVLQKTIDI